MNANQTLASPRFALWLENWRNPHGPTRVSAVVLTLTLCVSIAWLVYHTGGSQTPYPHLMYAAVLLGAFYFRARGGVAVGILGGLLLGPFMPLNVEAGIAQQTSGWMLRTSAYSGIGFISGLCFWLLNEQLDRLRHLAYHDNLTGLPNDSALRERLLSLNDAHGRRVLALFKIQNLERIGDVMGAHGVRIVLRQLASRLREAFPDALALAQVRPDELALLCLREGEPDPRECLNVFQRLQEAPLAVDGVPVYVDPVVGVARSESRAQDGDLLARAQIAANRARTQRSNAVIYEPRFSAEAQENLRLLGQLRAAVGSAELSLHYQEKYDLRLDRVVGVEALLRWTHPTVGNIPPGRFLPLAEETGLMRPLTQWVLRTALQQIVQWRREGVELEVAVNLSARDVQDPVFLRELPRLLDEHRVMPGHLQLEVTESALLDAHPEEVAQGLQSLRAMGVRVAIDDFGTGYSSLAYLKDLPADVLKIDRAFISAMRESAAQQTIVRHIVDMSHELGLAVVAEGVEDAQVLEMLRALGCDQIQGYFIGRPTTADELLRRLAA